MSFSNPPDARTLGRVAGALAVNEAFVEKDWYVVQAIRALLTLGDDDIMPVFSGGTSLLKGHRLIRRFSEDIDFKLQLSAAFTALTSNQQRKRLGEFSAQLADLWMTTGFGVLKVEAGSGNAFVRIEMDYPTILTSHAALRPHILAELSAKPPALAITACKLASFVAEFRGTGPEVAAIACVDPVETAADKLSAFTWRAIARDRGTMDDDPTIVRHLHDLAALETVAKASAAFPALLAATLEADTSRGRGAVQGMAPSARLKAMLERLASDPGYSSEYREFVEGMAFAGASEVPDFEHARGAVVRLCALLPA